MPNLYHDVTSSHLILVFILVFDPIILMPVVQVGQLELVEKEATPEKPKQTGNREKMRRKEENWEVIFIISSIMCLEKFCVVSLICRQCQRSL